MLERNVHRLSIAAAVLAVTALLGWSDLANAEAAPTNADAAPAEPAPAAGGVDFNRDIRPILSNHCFACHGPDAEQRKAGLRLDTREGATADLGLDIRAVAPGSPGDSELVYRITADNADRMPPAKHGKPLKPREIELLTRWVKQGADYARHWSYVKPQRPDLPKIKHDDWARNAIDHFIAARLEAANLSPQQPADRYALIRRLSLDLTGLPPTIEEADAFANDTRPDAYPRLVERLLAEPIYGERWATVWLDLARYADSAGYADDPPRTIWGYRDWVIRAFNSNMPFDQFTIEQMAGDLLPNPTNDQLIATAFHRNTLTNNEGGTNDEEFRNVAIVDRVNTTLAVWMGTTMACAQCHTHKYDPITQEEYFEFFAFLNNTADADRRDESPTVEVWNEQQRQQEKAWRAQVAQLERELKEDSPALREAQRTWEQQITAKAEPGVIGRFVRVQIVDRQDFLSLAEVEVFSAGENIATKGKAEQSSTDYNGPAKLAIDGNTDGRYEAAKSTSHTAKEKNPWWRVDLGEPAPIERIVLWNRTDGVGDRLKGFVVAVLDDKQQTIWQQRVDVAPNPKHDLTIGTVPADVLAIAKIPAEQRAAEQASRIDNYYRAIAPLLAAKRKQLAELKQKLTKLKPYTTVPVLRELPDNQRRTTRIQIRGNFLETGEEVSAGVPESLFGWPADAPKNRLALAKWLVHRDNPLTARVIVNRYWEKLFGTGLVATSEEFGAQGEQPSHPQLLDWLAVEFMESGWDVKHLLRLIVNSATYRQASHVTPALLQADPFNRLLSRGPRVRVSAEMVRDQALFVGGLLSDKMYGPPVNPPQPRMGVNAAFGSGIDWQTSAGEDRYRRGLYTMWRRSNPYPSMAAFDAPNREVCTVRRDRTNTPLQALVTLNDPVYIEAAQALARRIVREKPDGDAKARAAYAFRLCLTRPPHDAEIDRLVKLFDRARSHFAGDAAAAKAMATDPLGAAPEGMDVVDLAAWTVVGNVLLNVDEMFMPR